MSIHRLNLERNEMRRLVKDFFRRLPESEVSKIDHWIAESHKANNPGSYRDSADSLCDEDNLQLRGVIWDMIREGVLNPGTKTISGWLGLHVTEEGKAYFDGK
jgi:hypothetical protein